MVPEGVRDFTMRRSLPAVTDVLAVARLLVESASAGCWPMIATEAATVELDAAVT